MKVLGRERITATPQVQTWAAGKAVLTPGPGPAFTFWGSVQPIGAAQLERLPEATRRSARWIIYAEPPTPVLDPTPPAHRLQTSQGELVHVGDINYTPHTTGLPHVAYACAEVGFDEPSANA